MLCLASMRYKCWKSGGEDRLIFLMVVEDAPDRDVPHPVRCLGPWQGHREGVVSRLRPRYRQLLIEQRFVVIRPKTLGAFGPEVARCTVRPNRSM